MAVRLTEPLAVPLHPSGACTSAALPARTDPLCEPRSVGRACHGSHVCIAIAPMAPQCSRPTRHPSCTTSPFVTLLSISAISSMQLP
eukprot:scaffold109174_cov34-Tisochrysis_lutea.AAC.2